MRFAAVAVIGVAERSLEATCARNAPRWPNLVRPLIVHGGSHSTARRSSAQLPGERRHACLHLIVSGTATALPDLWNGLDERATSPVGGSLQDAIAHLAIDAPIFLTQNDGTLIGTDVAARLPILTCSAGPTNSIRGAALLTGLSDAIVADIGGTTTDIGFLRKGFPRETTTPNRIGGVRTNFRMPDVLSIAMGGGSLVTRDIGGWRVGPKSVGFRLQSQGMVFGGSSLTATDVAVRAGYASIGDASRVAQFSESDVEAMLDDMHAQVEDGIDQVKVGAAPLPLILVGGGNILLARPLRGTSEVLRPPHAEVANAIGAAIAMVSGRVNRLFDVARYGRDIAIDQAKGEAVAAAVAAGAAQESVEIVDLEELPMTHMKTGSVQIRVRAIGPLAALSS